MFLKPLRLCSESVWLTIARMIMYRRATIISLLAAGLVGGLALGRAGVPAAWWWLVGAVVAAWLLRRTRLALASWFIIVLVLGLWRTAAWQEQSDRFVALIGQNVDLQGIIADDPTAGDNRQMSYKLKSLTLLDKTTGKTVAHLPGTITIYSYASALQRGYRLEVTGTVKHGYGNALVSMSYPRMTILDTKQSELEQWRQHFLLVCAQHYRSRYLPLGSAYWWVSERLFPKICRLSWRW